MTRPASAGIQSAPGDTTGATTYSPASSATGPNAPSTLETVETDSPPARETTTVAPATVLPSGRVIVPVRLLTRAFDGTYRKVTGNGTTVGVPVNTAVASLAPFTSTCPASVEESAGATRHDAAPAGTWTVALMTDPPTANVGAVTDLPTTAISSPNE